MSLFRMSCLSLSPVTLSCLEHTLCYPDSSQPVIVSLCHCAIACHCDFVLSWAHLVLPRLVSAWFLCQGSWLQLGASSCSDVNLIWLWWQSTEHPHFHTGKHCSIAPGRAVSPIISRWRRIDTLLMLLLDQTELRTWHKSFLSHLFISLASQFLQPTCFWNWGGEPVYSLAGIAIWYTSNILFNFHWTVLSFDKISLSQSQYNLLPLEYV